MKAITLTQPWATLVSIGAKRIETRSWGTSYRGPLAIHAAKGFPLWAREFTLEPVCYNAVKARYSAREIAQHAKGLRAYPLGCVLATCRLVDCIQMRELHYGPDGEPAGILGKYTGMLNGCDEREFGDYAYGRYAWILADVQSLPVPVPAKGALSLWEWRIQTGDKDA